MNEVGRGSSRAAMASRLEKQPTAGVDVNRRSVFLRLGSGCVTVPNLICRIIIIIFFLFVCMLFLQMEKKAGSLDIPRCHYIQEKDVRKFFFSFPLFFFFLFMYILIVRAFILHKRTYLYRTGPWIACAQTRRLLTHDNPFTCFFHFLI